MARKFNIKVSKRSFLKINLEEWGRAVKCLSHVSKCDKLGELHQFFDVVYERYYDGYHLNYVVGRMNQEFLDNCMAKPDDDTSDFIFFLKKLPKEDYLLTAQWLDDFLESDYLENLYVKGRAITKHLRNDDEWHYANAYGHITAVTKYIEFTCRRMSAYLKLAA